MASARSIVEAAKSIPMMKENLRKAFEELQSHSSSLASFTLQWKDIDVHFSGIEKSIEVRLKELESKAFSMPEKSLPAPAVDNFPDESEATPRPELKSLCLKSDGKGLLLFIIKNRKEDLAEIWKEMIPALRLAPDPAELVLEAVEGFHPPKLEGENQIDRDFLVANKKSCILLLGCLHVISPVIKPPIKEKAKNLAVQWKGKISDSKEVSNSFAFLQLLVSYHLASEINPDEIIDAIVFVSRREQAIDFCRNLGLGYKVSDLIGKLNSMGRQLDAVKFVYAFDLVEQFPPVPILKAYINESKKIAEELRKKGKDSGQAQKFNDAKAIEIAALRFVIKAIEEYKLESEYSLDDLNKQIAELKPPKGQKKRNVQSTAAPSSKSQEQPSKRPRPSSTTTTSATVTTSAAVPTSATTSSVVMAYPTGQYLSSALPYGRSGGGSLYKHVSPSFVGNPLEMGANQRPTVPYAYPSDLLMASGLYARPMSYGSYPPPGGLPSQFNFNPSLYHQ